MNGLYLTPSGASPEFARCLFDAGRWLVSKFCVLAFAAVLLVTMTSPALADQEMNGIWTWKQIETRDGRFISGGGNHTIVDGDSWINVLDISPQGKAIERYTFVREKNTVTRTLLDVTFESPTGEKKVVDKDKGWQDTFEIAPDGFKMLLEWPDAAKIYLEQEVAGEGKRQESTGEEHNR